jgi:hypothetical protein
MALAFPAIRTPITRSLRPGVFPVRRFAGQTGAIVTTIRGDRANELELVLGFPYITDEQVALIWATWHATLGGFREVTLPGTALQGIDPALVAKIRPYVGWYMSAPPEVTSVQPGLSRVEVRFAGRLAGTGGAITVAPDADPLMAPCAEIPERELFIVAFDGTAWQPSGGFTVTANGYFHIQSNPEAGPSTLPGLAGYNALDQVPNASAYRFDFVESGWNNAGAVNLDSALIATDGGAEITMFFMGVNATVNAGGAWTATTQRLYRIRLNPASGAIIAASAWDRTLITESGVGESAYNGFAVWAAKIDTDGSFYLATGVRSVATSSTFGYPTLIKFNANGTQAWSVRINVGYFWQIRYMDIAGDHVYVAAYQPHNYLNDTNAVSALFKFSKSTGALVGTPARYTIDSAPFNITSMTQDGEGNTYLNMFRAGSPRLARILKVDTNLDPVWCKTIPVRDAFPVSATPPATIRAIAWDSSRNRLLIAGTYSSDYPAFVAVTDAGVPIKSWGMVSRTGGWSLDTQLYMNGYKSAIFGGNMIVSGEDFRNLWSIPMSLEIEDTVLVRPTASSSAVFGELPLSTTTSHAVARVAATGWSAATDSGNAFVATATSVSTTALASTIVGARMLYPPV